MMLPASRPTNWTHQHKSTRLAHRLHCRQKWILSGFDQWYKFACSLRVAVLKDREAAVRAGDYVYDNRLGVVGGEIGSGERRGC